MLSWESLEVGMLPFLPALKVKGKQRYPPAGFARWLPRQPVEWSPLSPPQPQVGQEGPMGMSHLPPERFHPGQGVISTATPSRPPQIRGGVEALKLLIPRPEPTTGQAIQVRPRVVTHRPEAHQDVYLEHLPIILHSINSYSFSKNFLFPGNAFRPVRACR